MPDEMYNIEQAAAIVGVKPEAVRLLIREGSLRAWKLPTLKGGDTTLVRKSDLMRMREAAQVKDELAASRASIAHLIHPSYLTLHAIEPLPLYCGLTEASCGSPIVIDPSAAHSDGDGFDNMAEADVFTWQDLKSKVCLSCLLTYLQGEEGGDSDGRQAE